MISLGGLVSQKAFGKFEMGKVISNPFANAFVNEGVDMDKLEFELKHLKKNNPGKKVEYHFIKSSEYPNGYYFTVNKKIIKNIFKNEAEGSEDHEVSMGQNQLDTIIKMATELKSKMGENEKEIPAWIQDHISKAENYISQAAGNYHEYGTNESSIKEDYDGPAILKTGDKNALKVGEKITINSGGKKKEYKVVKSNGNGDFVLHLVKESVNEASYTNYNLGKVQYTDKNMTPTDILSLAMAYVETSGNKMLGGKLGNMVTVANDLARLTGTTQLNAKERGKKPALIIHLLKNKLVSKDEYVKLYKDLIEKQISVIKSLKNADPASRMVGGAAARQAHKDMKGEFDESIKIGRKK
jgi:hypothetical protein